MNRNIFILLLLFQYGCEAANTTGIIQEDVLNIPTTQVPVLPAVNVDLFPNLNWNDVVSGRTDSYDFNQDGVPDVMAHEAAVLPDPPVFRIGDFRGRTIFQFDLKKFNPSVRDSLHWIGFDSGDIDNDGDLDLVLHYHGEFQLDNNGSARYIGSNIYVLVNKGHMQYDVIEIYDNPNEIFFQQILHDWDGDGLLDLMVQSPRQGEYFKNLGENRFEYRKMQPLALDMDGASISGVDFTGDGKSDKINLFGGNYYHDCTRVHQTHPQYLYVLSGNIITRYPVTGTLLRKNLRRCTGTASYERINMVDGDGDGDLDLVVSFDVVSDSQDIMQRSDYFENLNGSFVHRPGYIDVPGRNLYHQYLQVWVRDIDGDGRKDLYYGTYSKSRMDGVGWQPFWWRNTGQGFKINTNFRIL